MHGHMRLAMQTSPFRCRMMCLQGWRGWEMAGVERTRLTRPRLLALSMAHMCRMSGKQTLIWAWCIEGFISLNSDL